MIFMSISGMGIWKKCTKWRWLIGCARPISPPSNNILLTVYDEDGTLLGAYYADLLIEHVLIVEIKAGRVFALEHEAQILGYLRSAKLEHGLLINFGSQKFEIRKFAWSQMVTRRPLAKRWQNR